MDRSTESEPRTVLAPFVEDLGAGVDLLRNLVAQGDAVGSLARETRQSAPRRLYAEEVKLLPVLSLSQLSAWRCSARNCLATHTIVPAPVPAA